MERKPVDKKILDKIMEKRKDVESEIDKNDVVVIDNGTDTVKIGISGCDYPQIIIDTVAGTAELSAESDVVLSRKVFFGDLLKQALHEKKYPIRLSYPIEESRIEEKKLEEMTEMWRYALTELLGLDLATTDILLIDSPLNNKQYKAKVADQVFQKLNIRSLLFMNSSTLSLFSTGATTGFVAELGHGTSTVVPVFEGFVLPHALQKSTISGKEITKCMEQQLKNERNPSFLYDCRKITINASNSLEMASIIRSIKEKMCRVAQHYESELAGPDDRDEEMKCYELPDGQVITLSKQTVYRPTEILFAPSLVGSNSLSLTEMMKDSLGRCDPELAMEMMKNIVVCGGTSVARGIQKRLESEFAGEEGSYNFVLNWQRRYSSWIGGSMLGSLSTFQSLAIQFKDYTTVSDNKLSMIYKMTF